jgi:hypothetical protein
LSGRFLAQFPRTAFIGAGDREGVIIKTICVPPKITAINCLTIYIEPESLTGVRDVFYDDAFGSDLKNLGMASVPSTSQHNDLADLQLTCVHCCLSVRKQSPQGTISTLLLRNP